MADLIITYTSPAHYEDSAPLCEQIGNWEHLPGFPPRDDPDDSDELLFIGMGFVVEGLQRHIASIKKHKAIKVLIPFPAPLSPTRRTWDSVYRLEAFRKEEKFENYLVGANDLPSAFERVRSLAVDAPSTAAFAPFGPKPISAAMCLFAIQHDCGVYYPQPEIYHPDYSKGIGVIGGQPAVHAYWIKHNGRFLYATGGQ